MKLYYTANGALVGEDKVNCDYNTYRCSKLFAGATDYVFRVPVI